MIFFYKESKFKKKKIWGGGGGGSGVQRIQIEKKKWIDRRQAQTNVKMDGKSNRPKPIFSINFFEVGVITMH